MFVDKVWTTRSLMNSIISRRNALKALIGATAAVALGSLPKIASASKTAIAPTLMGISDGFPPSNPNRQITKAIQWLDLIFPDEPTHRELTVCTSFDDRIEKAMPLCGMEYDLASTKEMRHFRGMEYDFTRADGKRQLKFRSSNKVAWENKSHFNAAITKCGLYFLMGTRDWMVIDIESGAREIEELVQSGKSWASDDLPKRIRSMETFKRFEFGPPDEATIVEKITFGGLAYERFEVGQTYGRHDQPMLFEINSPLVDNLWREGKISADAKFKNTHSLGGRVVEIMEAQGFDLHRLWEWMKTAERGQSLTLTNFVSGVAITKTDWAWREDGEFAGASLVKKRKLSARA
jgi:hypothetical protein